MFGIAKDENGDFSGYEDEAAERAVKSVCGDSPDITTGDHIIDNSIRRMKKIDILRLKIAIAIRVKSEELSIGNENTAGMIQMKINEYEKEIRYLMSK